MSKLQTYDRSHDFTGLPRPWPYAAIDRVADQPLPDLAPGMWVELPGGDPKGLGMVIAVNAEQLTIMWSVEPMYPWKGVLPRGTRVAPSLYPNTLVGIQPLPMPSSKIFYMDFTYGDKLTKRCDNGPWVSKAFWRSVRWVRNKAKSAFFELKHRLRKRSRSKELERFTSKWMKIAGTEDDLDYKRKLIEKVIESPRFPWDGKPPAL